MTSSWLLRKSGSKSATVWSKRWSKRPATVVTTLSAETSLLPSCCRQTCTKNEYIFDKVCVERRVCCLRVADYHGTNTGNFYSWYHTADRLMYKEWVFDAILLQSADKRVQRWNILYTNHFQRRVRCQGCCGQVRTKTDNNCQSYRMKMMCCKKDMYKDYMAANYVLRRGGSVATMLQTKMDWKQSIY